MCGGNAPPLPPAVPATWVSGGMVRGLMAFAFSSANASQKALWVTKLSLLLHNKVKRKINT